MVGKQIVKREDLPDLDKSMEILRKSGLELALDMAARWYPGVPLSIPKDWAEQLIKHKKLELKDGPGDITGEAHVTFEHKGQVIRLKRTWTKSYLLFHGEWKPDPHWTGD